MSLRRRVSTDPRPETSDSGSSRGTVRLLVTVLALAWLFRSLVFAPFSIPSGSMLPALYIGDYVLVAKWPYGYSTASFPFGIPSFDGRLAGGVPKRGDVVVFVAPDEDSDVVKRVIGLPGDTVAVTGGMLILNGQPLPRVSEGMVAIPLSPNSPCRVVPGATPQLTSGNRDCLYPAYRETLPGGPSYRVLDQIETARADNFAPVRVPAGHVFLMGDNRDDSLDSRYPRSEGGLGFVPMENLIGRASFIIWSTDGSADYWKPWTWFTALRSDRIGSGFNEPASPDVADEQ